ncbi:glycosyltransferase [Paenibacillus filicis]|uniref:Glycosyltransferase n=1 Tax=Paenibacillus gyeongsangnamensis TaxID=3388067 RepID=A0ABT4Q8G7_9BACL|nr:nucleotide disphospho-sugar-binding domain-containing protein [Paenibacillus filicis]MCZ8513168.1 glycosyltransferase [Paenibacillus filicis]
MARFLFAVWPSAGHVNPGLPLAKELAERGHEVMFYTSTHFKEKVEATGATFIPFKNVRNFSGSTLNEDFPDMPKYKGIKFFKWGIRNIIANTMEGFDKDIAEIREKFKADVLVIDPTFTGLIPIRLRGDKIKTACFGILPLSVTSKDTAPFGLGILPNHSFMGQMKNRMLNFFVQKIVFSQEQNHFNQILSRMNLPKLDPYFFDAAVHYSDLYFQGTCRSFEYPRSDLPSNVKFVGPYNPPVTAVKTPLPKWWPDLNSGKPVVHVTQGTLANEDFSRLMIPTIKALANKDVLVVATTGNRPISMVGDHLPKNVRVEPFIPYTDLMPHVDIMITNAGYGGVHYAIQNAVPLIVAGKTEDKPEVCARVEWAGIGINLKTDRPTEQQISSAVDTLLSSPRFKQRITELQQEFSSYDAYRISVTHLEELAASSQ